MIRVFRAELQHAPLFDHVHADVFDGPVLPDMLSSFLADPKQHIFVATDDGVICGICSGMQHHHPDKRPDMWINELSVAAPWRRQGLATRMISALCEYARTLACTQIWVVADPTDMAEGFYASLGWERTGTRLSMFSRTL